MIRIHHVIVPAIVAILLLAAMPARAQTAAPDAAAPGTERIAAIVNNDAITASELSARTRLILASSGLADTPDVRQKLTPEIINALIEERLMVQEAARNKIKITPEEITQGFAQLSKQNNMTPEQFQEVLAHGHIPMSTINKQIESQIAWTHVIEQKIRPDIVISDDQIDEALAREKSDIGRTQYLVADIFLPIGSPQDEGTVRQLADKLVHEITDHHAPFQGVASQFSQAPGASKGGDLGWVQDDQLAPPVAEALSNLAEGAISKPVRTPEGYHILMLRKKTQLTAETVPSREDIMEKLGLQELDRRQRRHMLDLKASAFIERRV